MCDCDCDCDCACDCYCYCDGDCVVNRVYSDRVSMSLDAVDVSGGVSEQVVVVLMTMFCRLRLCSKLFVFGL